MRPLGLSELLDRFLAWRNNDPFKNSLDPRDENHYKKSVFWLGECHPKAKDDVSVIDGEAFRAFQVFLVHTVKNKEGGQHSRTYINALTKYGKHLFSWGADQRPRLISEMQDFQISKVMPLPPSPKIRESAPRKNVAFEPVKAALEVLDTEYPACGDAMRIQFLNGMRPAEALGIKSCYIDYDYDGENWHFQPDKHKTAGRGKRRDFVFGKLSRQILEKHKPDDPNRCFFLNKRGNPITVWRYDTVLRKLIEKHGLKKFVPYQLRHAIATLVDKKLGLEYAQLYLGHADSKMTEHYLHEQIDKIRTVSVFLDSALGETLFTPEPAPPAPLPPESEDSPAIIPIHLYRRA